MDVDLLSSPPLVRVGVPDWRKWAGDASVADQDADGAEAPLCLFDRAFHVRDLCHIPGHGDSPPTRPGDGLRCLIDLVLGTCHERDARASRRVRLRDGAADAAPSTRDESYFTFEWVCHTRPPNQSYKFRCIDDSSPGAMTRSG